MSFTNPLLKNLDFLLKGITDEYVGNDVRYSSDFEEIESLLSNTSTLLTNNTIDWARVIELSEKILATQSKDLRVLSWFAWGQYKVNSFIGLHASIAIINQLITTCWQDIFPKKDRTRISATEWLASRIDGIFQESFPIKNQLPLFEALQVELTQLDLFLTDKWQDKSPLLLPTCRRLGRMIQETTQTIEAEPKEGVVEKIITQVKEVVSNTIGTAPTTIENDNEAIKLFRDIQNNSKTLCNWWLTQKPTDIKALCLNRTLLWLTIVSPPEHKDHITPYALSPQT